MPPIPTPGHGPIGGSVVHFGLPTFILTFLSLVGYVTWARDNPFLLFTPLIVFAAFTEEFVFEVVFTWPLGLLYLVVLIPAVMLNKRRLKLPRGVTIAYLVVVLVLVISFLFSLRFIGSATPPRGVFARLLRETGRWVILLAVPLLIYLQVDSRQTWIRLVNVQVGIAGVISLVSFVSLLFTYLGVFPSSLAATLIEPGGITLRLTGTFTEPSQFATYLTLSFFLGVGLVIESSFRRRYVSLVCLSLIAVSIVLTYSTSAFVMFIGSISVAGLFILDALNQERNDIYEFLFRGLAIVTGGTLTMLIVGLGLNFLLTNVVRSVPNLPGPQLFFAITIGKLMTITESASARWFALLTGLRMWMENPILGVGLGNHFYLSTKFSPHSLSSRRGPISTFVGVLATTGLVGLTAFTLYLVEIHRQVRTALLASISAEEWILIGVYLTFFGLVTGYGINASFRTVFNAVFLGLVLSSVKYMPGTLKHRAN